jgi:uncharacterized membrane protein
MESRTKLLGHPVHQMLIVFPLGLLAMAVIFDVLAIAAGNGYWSEIAYWMITAGCITGLLAAPFGFIDWLAIRRVLERNASEPCMDLGMWSCC